MTGPGQGAFVQMGGGYEEAVRPHLPQAQQQQQFQPQTAQQMAQQIQSQLPPQMQPRFGDPRPPSPAQQQAAAGQWAQQLPFMSQQQQQQAPAGLDLGTRLSGPNVPPDLQGRSIGEVIAINQGLRQIHLQNMGQPQVQQPRPPVQQAPTQQQAAPAASSSGFDWRNPEKSIGEVVDKSMGKFMQQLQDSIAPAMQGAALNGITTAKNVAAAAIGPMFAQFEPQILASLQGADPRMLQNPGAWQVAAERVIGATALAAARQQEADQSAQQFQQPQYAQQGWPQAQPVPNFNTPPLGSFFSEQPNQGGPGASGVQLSPNQRAAAQAMNMTEGDYAAWLGGAPRGAR